LKLLFQVVASKVDSEDKVKGESMGAGAVETRIVVDRANGSAINKVLVVNSEGASESTIEVKFNDVVEVDGITDVRVKVKIKCKIESSNSRRFVRRFSPSDRETPTFLLQKPSSEPGTPSK
jgi:hypothetical protein